MAVKAVTGKWLFVAYRLWKRFLTERTVLQPLEKISWYPRVDFIRDLDRTCEEYKEISFFPTADELLRKMTPLYAVFHFLHMGTSPGGHSSS